MKQPTDRQIIAACEWADSAYGREGEIEIDVPAKGDAKIQDAASACDDWKAEGGFYVKAWIWVPLKENRT